MRGIIPFILLPKETTPKSMHIGYVKKGSNNISSVAARFATDKQQINTFSNLILSGPEGGSAFLEGINKTIMLFGDE